MPRDSSPLTARMSPLQYQVWYAYKRGPEDATEIMRELQEQRRLAFNDELTTLNYSAGCYARSGNLRNTGILDIIAHEALSEAAGIVSTFNYDLAAAVLRLGDEGAKSKAAYMRELPKWEAARSSWKAEQIATYTQGVARAMAQKEWLARNAAVLEQAKYARLDPRAAKCPVCQGWINRGSVPAAIALNHPPPYHVLCPHVWEIKPGKLAPGECGKLWNGE